MSANNTEERLLKIKKVREYIDFSESKIYDLVKQKEFPSPIRIGGTSVWRFTEIQDYISKMIENARTA